MHFPYRNHALPRQAPQVLAIHQLKVGISGEKMVIGCKESFTHLRKVLIRKLTLVC